MMNEERNQTSPQKERLANYSAELHERLLARLNDNGIWLIKLIKLMKIGKWLLNSIWLYFIQSLIQDIESD